MIILTKKHLEIKIMIFTFLLLIFYFIKEYIIIAIQLMIIKMRIKYFLKIMLKEWKKMK